MLIERTIILSRDCISSSVHCMLAWLVNKHSMNNGQTLLLLLQSRGARAVFQFYPENPDQVMPM